MKRKAAKKLLEVLSPQFSNLTAGKVETAVIEDKEVYLFDEKIEFVTMGRDWPFS